MREKTLRNLAVFCSVFGLVLLFYASNQITLTTNLINDITPEDIGSSVKVCGEISSTRISRNHIFWDIKDDSGEIRFVIFNTTALNLNKSGKNIYEFKNGDNICSIGVVDEYPKGSGSLEIIYRRGEIERT